MPSRGRRETRKERNAYIGQRKRGLGGQKNRGGSLRRSMRQGVQAGLHLPRRLRLLVDPQQILRTNPTPFLWDTKEEKRMRKMNQPPSRGPTFIVVITVEGRPVTGE